MPQLYTGNNVQNPLPGGEVWNWIFNTTITKNANITQCLRTSEGWGGEYLTENLAPEITHFCTAHGLTREQVQALTDAVVKRGACLKLTTPQGWKVSGRVVGGVNINNNSSEADSSALFTASLQLRDITNEAADNPTEWAEF